MKKVTLFLISILSIISLTVSAQGWIGNSNNLIAHNSSLNLTPLKIGVGVNAPTSLFHTNGTLRFQGLTQATASPFNRLLITDNNGNVRWYDLNSLSTNDNDWDNSTNTPHMFNLNTGNIGIGVNNPSERLDLAGNLRLTDPADLNSLMLIRPSIDVSLLNPGSDNSGFNPSTVAGQITNRQQTHLVIDIIANDVEDSFAIRTDSNTDGTVDNLAFVVKPSGNIGIGSNSPNSRLQITGGDIYIENINNGVIMRSTNGNCWRMTIDNSGIPVVTNIICP